MLNYEIQGTYVRNWSEFTFYPKVPDQIAYFNSRFQRTILATNQRGVTRGVMSLEDLEQIHYHMIRGIENAGGRIDRIYYCVDADPASPCRKPNPGMALQAAADFPEINLSKSIMVGNNISDMLFGRNAGMKTVFLATTSPDQTFPHGAIDIFFKNLEEFTEALKKA